MLKRNEFKAQVQPVIDWVDSYFDRLETFPVKSKVQPGQVLKSLPQEPPKESQSIEEMVKDLDELILPGITHWQHPNFHAYFPANSSVESLLGEIVTAAIGAQCMIWDTSPAAAELEELTMNWLKGMMGLPENFEGVIQDSASSATLVAILSAREKITEFKANQEGVPNNLRVYCSSETHSSIDKAVGIAGIGKRNLVKIAVDENLAMVPEELETQIRSDLENGFVPTCVIASIGTTSTCAVDPLSNLAQICKDHDVWLHVDAAYAGNAMVLPEYRWMMEGLEEADSLVFNSHKWMFTNFDCSAYFVKDVDTLIRTFEILPEYLKTSSRGIVNDYRDWGIPLGRRFRALKLWFVIRGYGVDGIQKRFREHMELSAYFAREIEADSNFELMTEPFLNITCFRFLPDSSEDSEAINSLNEELVEKINTSGELYLTHTKVRDQYTLRMVIGQTYVEKHHIEKALRVIKTTASSL